MTGARFYRASDLQPVHWVRDILHLFQPPRLTRRYSYPNLDTTNTAENHHVPTTYVWEVGYTRLLSRALTFPGLVMSSARWALKPIRGALETTLWVLTHFSHPPLSTSCSAREASVGDFQPMAVLRDPSRRSEAHFPNRPVLLSQ